MKKKSHYIPILCFAINILIYSIFKILFRYDLNRKLYYEFHTEIVPILILMNISISVLFFVLLYLRRKYTKMYYALIPIILYIIILFVSLIKVFR